jgi:hypothetical protein
VSNLSLAQQLAKTIRSEAEQLIGVASFFDTMQTPEVHAKLGPMRKPSTVETAILVRRMCMGTWVMALARLTDPWGKDRHSIPSALKRLDGVTGEELLSIGGSYNALESARRIWAGIDGNHSLVKVRDMRHEQLAHLLPDLGSKLPYLADVRRVHACLIRIADRLSRATGIASVRLSASAPIWDQRHTAFWAKFQGDAK